MSVHCCCYILLFILPTVFGRPFSPQYSKNQYALNFLSSFGYLNSDELFPHENGAINPNIITDALKKYQKFFKLNVTGVVDAATETLMKKPRCGNPDLTTEWPPNNSPRRVRRYFIEDPAKKWLSNVVYYKISSYPTRGLSQNAVDAIFRQAFNIWSMEADINFESNRAEADIVIEFGSGHHGDSIPFDGPGKVLAHAYYPNPMAGYSRAGDMHFDDDELWSDDKEYGRSLLSVAVHELGHALGLGHSDIETAIMYPYYTPPKEDSSGNTIRLDQDDITAIRVLYKNPPANKNIPSVPNFPPASRPPGQITTSTPLPTKPSPNFCNISIDAIVQVRSLEMQIFSGNWLWRMVWSKTPTNWFSYEYRDGPELYSYYWPALPDNLAHIDTILEGHNGRIWVFRGKRFWVLSGNTMRETGVPDDGLPITALGLPKDLEKIDTMFHWDEDSDGKPQKVFIFANDLFWEFNELAGLYGKVWDSPAYPQKIKKVWRGLPTPIDAAFTRHNGETYFFKNNEYYSFNNYQMKVRPGFPKETNLPWLGCLHSRETKIHN